VRQCSPVGPLTPPLTEGELLAEQEQAVLQVSQYVSQLRRVGKGLGVFQFDKELAAANKA